MTAAPVVADATAGPVDRRAPAAGRGRRLALLAALVGLVALACVLSLAVGERPISPATTWSALVARTPGLLDHDIVWGSRLPRTVAGLTVGAAIAVAGAVIQAVTRNPLADPGILGVNAGAALAMAVGVGLGATTMRSQLWTALVGALLATVAVHLIGAAGGRIDIARMTLAGVALAAMLSGLTTAVTLLDPQAFDALRQWTVGSLSARGLGGSLLAMPFVVVGIALALALARTMDALALGDELAVGLGARPVRTRVLAVVAVTLTCGAATAVAGPVGFVGLAIPHLVRWVVGPNQGWILGLSVLAGPVMLLGADVLGRVVVTGGLQVGIVTAFLGAPMLIAMSRRGVSGL